MKNHTPSVIGGLALAVVATLMPGVARAQPASTSPNDSTMIANRLDPVAKSSLRVPRISGSRVVSGKVSVDIKADVALNQTGGTAVLDTAKVDYVVRGLEDGVQILAVARDVQSLTQQYDLTGKFLELREDGAVVVREGDVNGEPVAYIDPAWAKDANGAPLRTRFSIHGSTLIQVTEASASTKFPVVADPRLRGAWYGWSIDFTKYETGRMSKSTAQCVAVAGLIAVGSGTAGIIAGAVAAACGALTVFADTAVENGKCVSVKVLLGGYAVIPWMPKCYA